ncbi:MAG: HAEPLYID family protein [Flavobacteriales bacterium]
MRKSGSTLLLSFLFLTLTAAAQTAGDSILPKVRHAEPLYNDLVRDLGARRGEQEWNLGMGLEDHKNYHSLTSFVEYEFAPVNRLGIEFELPVSVHFPSGRGNGAIPMSRINGLKMATQYSFFVSPKLNMTLAAGYTNDFEAIPYTLNGKTRFHFENTSMPFFVAAKSWKTNLHTLLYFGPAFTQHFSSRHWEANMMINTNIHYMFPGTKNFIGLEINKEFGKHAPSIVFRPQARIVLSQKMMLGVVTGIPLNRTDEGMSLFVRLIYEPARFGKK